jgi:hypothetical protein
MSLTNEERVRNLINTIQEPQAFPNAMDASTVGLIQGLSRRDYIACRAFQPLLNLALMSPKGFTLDGNIKMAAAAAVKAADELCAALDQPREEVQKYPPPPDSL